MLFPCALIRLSCLTAISCCAMPALAPNNKVPTTTTNRIIEQFSIARAFFLTHSRRHRELAYTGSRRSSIEPRGKRFIPSGRWRISEAVPALVLADRDPDPLGGRGHVDVIDFILAPQPLDDRIYERRTGPD